MQIIVMVPRYCLRVMVRSMRWTVATFKEKVIANLTIRTHF